MLRSMIEFAGDRFFIGSDYPHAEGFVSPATKTIERLKAIPQKLIQKVLYDNARAFDGL